MGPSWAPALIAAAALTTGVIPFLRRLALATGFVDRPGGHKSHHRPVPYLGGVGLIGGILVGMVLAPQMRNHIIPIALGAAVLGTVGLIDDYRTVTPGIRFALQLAAATVPVVLGLRVSVTGILVVDAVIAVVWIVGITNAFNLLDNMDGLSAGVALVVSASVLGLAVLGRQGAAAGAAAAVVGACLGFLLYNRRPASIFMGDTGSLFLGFAVAVLAIEVDPAVSPPASFLIPLLILGLPMLDTGTVILARVRRGRSPLQGGKDHLSHRLVALGLHPGAAVAVLVAMQAVLGGLAIAAGRRAIPLPLAAVAGAGVLLVLSIVTGRAPVYKDAVAGMPRVLVLGGGAALAVLVVLSASAGLHTGLAPQTTLRPIGSDGVAWATLAAAVFIIGSTLATITRRRRDAMQWMADAHAGATE